MASAAALAASSAAFFAASSSAFLASSAALAASSPESGGKKTYNYSTGVDTAAPTETKLTSAADTDATKAVKDELKEAAENGMITLFPDIDGTEGFFICRMEKDRKDDSE